MRKAKILQHNGHNSWSLTPIYQDIDELDSQDKGRIEDMIQIDREDVQAELSVGVNLKCILRLLGISTYQLSEIIGIDEEDICAWINMKSVLPITMVTPICDVLEISRYLKLIQI